ncbi:autotransporter-associated beta strand repeat-containing protein [Formicincola oecophyllae]|nr:autotransporter-associated beta strand repeat-containing protein [Formicincola oecophyllae]
MLPSATPSPRTFIRKLALLGMTALVAVPTYGKAQALDDSSDLQDKLRDAYGKGQSYTRPNRATRRALEARARHAQRPGGLLALRNSATLDTASADYPAVPKLGVMNLNAEPSGLLTLAAAPGTVGAGNVGALANPETWNGYNGAWNTTTNLAGGSHPWNNSNGNGQNWNPGGDAVFQGAKYQWANPAKAVDVLTSNYTADNPYDPYDNNGTTTYTVTPFNVNSLTFDDQSGDKTTAYELDNGYIQPSGSTFNVNVTTSGPGQALIWTSLNSPDGTAGAGGNNSVELVKQGGGTLLLGGLNSFPGGIDIQGGTLVADVIGLGGASASYSGGQNTPFITIENGAHLVLDQQIYKGEGTFGGQTSTQGAARPAQNIEALSSIIQGAGDVTMQDAGKVVLTAANTYTGATHINGGTLSLSGAGSIASSSVVDVTALGKGSAIANSTTSGHWDYNWKQADPSHPATPPNNPNNPNDPNDNDPNDAGSSAIDDSKPVFDISTAKSWQDSAGLYSQGAEIKGLTGNGGAVLLGNNTLLIDDGVASKNFANGTITGNTGATAGFNGATILVSGGNQNAVTFSNDQISIDNLAAGGSHGGGTINLNGGSVFTTLQNVNLGVGGTSATSGGTITLSGHNATQAAAQFTKNTFDLNTAHLTMGGAGNNTLNVNQGAQMQVWSGGDGSAAHPRTYDGTMMGGSGNNVINVDGTGTLFNTIGLQLGNAATTGTETFNVTNGAHAVAQGNGANAGTVMGGSGNNVINVDGTGTLFNTIGLQLGNATTATTGTETFNVTNGAHVVDQGDGSTQPQPGITSGTNAASVINVTGVGSELDANQGIFNGVNASSTINVADQGTLVDSGLNLTPGQGSAINLSNGGTITLNAANIQNASGSNATSALNVDGSKANGVINLNRASIHDTVINVLGNGQQGSGLTLNDGASSSYAHPSDAVYSTIQDSAKGPGGLTKTGAGTIVMYGANTYTGGTVIQDGTLVTGHTTNGVIDALGTGVVNLGASGQLSFGGWAAGTFNNLITGAGSVRSNWGQSGTTTLTNTNTYTGGTQIDAGSTLVAADQGANGTVNALGTGKVTNNGTLNINMGASAPAAVTFNNQLAGTGTLNKQGTDTVTLTGDDSAFTGQANVNAGTMLVNTTLGGAANVAQNASLGGVGTIKGNVNVASSGTLFAGDYAKGQTGTLNIGGDLNLAGNSNANFLEPTNASTGDLVKVAGTLTLDGALNMAPTAAGTTFGVGVYHLFTDGKLGDVSEQARELAGLTQYLAAGDHASLQTAINGQVNVVIYNTSRDGLYWNGGDANNGNQQIVGGNGTWNAATANRNWTDINGNAQANWDNSGVDAHFVANGGTVQVDDSQGAVLVKGLDFDNSQNGQGAIQPGTGNYTLQGDALTIAGPTLAVNVAGANNQATIASTLQAGAANAGAGLTKTGAGTLTLTGANSYTGATDIQQGTMALGWDGASAVNGTVNGQQNHGGSVGGSAVTVEKGATFDVSGLGKTGTDSQGNPMAGGITFSTVTPESHGARVMGLSGAGQVVLGDAGLMVAGNSTFNGTMTGSGQSTLMVGQESITAGTPLPNATTFTLSGATVSAGTIEVGAANGATLTINNGSQVNATAAYPALRIAENAAAGDSGTVNVDSAGTTLNANGITLGGLGGQAAGTGTAALNVTGGAHVDSGTAGFMSGYTAPATITVSGAGSQLSAEGGSYNGISSSSTLNVVDGGVLNLAGGGLVQANGQGASGILNLGNGGTINLGAGSTIKDGAGTTALNVDGSKANGLVNFADGTASVAEKNINVAGSGQQGSGLTLNIDDASKGAALVSGNINDATGKSGGLTKTGAGTVTLSGANNYSGGTLVQGGQLNGNAATSFGTGAINVAQGAALDYNDAGSDNQRSGNVISGAGQLNMNGAGDVTLLNANHYTGGTNVNAGTLTGNAGGSFGTGAIQVAQDATLAFNDTENDTAAAGNVISGAGRVNMIGTGDVTMNAVNSYTGGTDIERGTLTGTTQSFGTGAIADAGTLVLNQGTDATFANQLTGNGTFDKDGAGTVTIARDDSGFAGQTNINQGAMLVNGTLGGNAQVNQGGSLGGGTDSTPGTLAGNVNVAAGGTLFAGDYPNKQTGTLNIGGNLNLAQGSTASFRESTQGAFGGAGNDLVNVKGALTLDSGINFATPSDTVLADGVYHLMTYANGELKDVSETARELNIIQGTLAAGDHASLQTAIDGQVNVVVYNTSRDGLYWNGGDTNNGNQKIVGGNGTWNAATANRNWTDINGNAQANWDNSGVDAHFVAQGGTVQVDDSQGAVLVKGLDFDNSQNGQGAIQPGTGDYTIQGDALTIAGNKLTATVEDASNKATVASIIKDGSTGPGTLDKEGAGRLVLSGANTYTGGTKVGAGILQGTTSTFGKGAVYINQDANLDLNQDFDGTFTNTLTGNPLSQGNGDTNGTFTKDGTGTVTLPGSADRLNDAGFDGQTNVNGGTLLVNGVLGGNLTVNQGGTLGGGTDQPNASGIVNGNVLVNQGGTINPGQDRNHSGVLAIGGNLTLNSGSGAQFTESDKDVWAGPGNDLIYVTGNLNVNGPVSVTVLPGTTGTALNPTNKFVDGVLHLIDYQGTATGLSGLNLASLTQYLADPTNDVAQLQTAIAGQVNVVIYDKNGLYWNGGDTQNGNNQLDGSNGYTGGPVQAGQDFTWSASGQDSNWTNPTGSANSSWTNSGAATAYFEGLGGVVNIDDSKGQVAVKGLHFANVLNSSDSPTYTLQGDALQAGGATLDVSVVNDGQPAVGMPLNSALIKSQILDATGLHTKLAKDGEGILELSGNNTYSGGTDVAGGALVLDNVLSAGTGDILLRPGQNDTDPVTHPVTLKFNTDATGTWGQTTRDGQAVNQIISGGGSVEIASTDLTLNSTNTYSGGTTIDGGAMVTAADQGANSTVNAFGTGAIQDNGGTLNLNLASNAAFANTLSGTGVLNKQNADTITLTADDSGFTGQTNVDQGTLLVNGALGGNAQVNQGGSLGGGTDSTPGTLAGNVNVAAGGTLFAGDYPSKQTGTLNIGGNLNLAQGSTASFMESTQGAFGGAGNDLVNVKGALTLDSGINFATPSGTVLADGVYHLMTYANGELKDVSETARELNIIQGTLAAGDHASLQTAIDGQVNVVIYNTSRDGLYWNGGDANNGNQKIVGGNGTWNAATANRNWTDRTGNAQANWDNSGVNAIFTAQGGTVQVDDSQGAVLVKGLDFDSTLSKADSAVLPSSGSYTITGDALTIAGNKLTATVEDASNKATVASIIKDGTQDGKAVAGTLDKEGAGRLVLSGANSYTGGTTINQGTLEGTTANFGTGAVNVAQAGTLDLNQGSDATFGNQLTGNGTFDKDGAGTVTIARDDSGFAGQTNINQGAMLVNGALGGNAQVNQGASLGGTGTLGGNVNVAAGGTLFAGDYAKGQTGTLNIGGDLNLAGNSNANFLESTPSQQGDLVKVAGTLTLDGALNMVPTAAGTTFDVGVYHLFTDGKLGDVSEQARGLASLTQYLNTADGERASLQTNKAGQVNVVVYNTHHDGLRDGLYWDGTAAQTGDGFIRGGNGTWNAATTNRNWTDRTGNAQANWDNSGVNAIFTAQGAHGSGGRQPGRCPGQRSGLRQHPL